MNTIVAEKINGNDVFSDVFTRLVNDRIIFLCDYIDDRVATDLVATLLYLDSISSDKITIYINSEDGDLRSVFMLYDIMRLVKSPIHTICIGSATFTSALILAAGVKGNRYATKSSVICVSQLSADVASYVDMTDAKITYERIKKDNNKLVELLAKLTGNPLKKIKKDSERKFFLTPLQAKKYGLIDHVIDWGKIK